MDDVNLYTVSGRLIKEPQMRKTPTGIIVCDIYIAVNRKNNKRGHKKQSTMIIPITLWEKPAEYWGERLDISDHIFASGELVDNNFEKSNEKDDSRYKTNGRLKMYNAEIRLIEEFDKFNEASEHPSPIPIATI
jgi:single-stranded DNA-binding protein